MKDEYLWQKTGEDPEIEKLEKTLAVFRYREALPAAPVDDAADERVPRFWISFAFAFAACVAVAIVAAAWFQISRDESGSASAPEFVFVTAGESPATHSPAVSEPTAPAIRTTEPPARRIPLGREKVYQTTAMTIRRRKAKAAAPQDTIATLTAEERYAYRQLMLALSITGSKLKIVQNTIDGIQDTDETANKNQR